MLGLPERHQCCRRCAPPRVWNNPLRYTRAVHTVKESNFTCVKDVFVRSSELPAVVVIMQGLPQEQESDEAYLRWVAQACKTR